MNLQDKKQFVAGSLQTLLKGENLLVNDLEKVLAIILSGELGVRSEFTLGSILSLLDMKRVNVEDIQAIANSLKVISSPMPQVSFDGFKTIATVGSGKDEFKTVNVTTSASIVAASLGAKVAKVGCGSESSAAGTTDVLTLLGYQTDISFETSLEKFKQTGFGFFNPEFPLAKLFEIYIGRSLIFNPIEYVLPMYIGIKTDGLLYGLASPQTHLTGQLLLDNGYKDALIVCGQSNEGKYFDEISSLGETVITKIQNGKMESFNLLPEDIGISRGKDANLLQPTDKQKCAETVKAILQGISHPQQADIVAMNAGALLWISGAVGDLEEAVQLSLKQIRTGKAWAYFTSLINQQYV
jgi:anthranilate phosphoribosyltransferase